MNKSLALKIASVCLLALPTIAKADISCFRFGTGPCDPSQNPKEFQLSPDFRFGPPTGKPVPPPPPQMGGTFILENTDCVGYLTSDKSHMAPAGFVAGALIVVQSNRSELTISSASDTVSFHIGETQIDGGIDGPSLMANEYSRDGLSLTHGYENLKPGDNFGQLLISRTSIGMTISQDGVTCNLAPAIVH